ncbi:hypothetical protein ACMFMG_012032 [Clarireedia jacksonii]
MCLSLRRFFIKRNGYERLPSYQQRASDNASWVHLLPDTSSTMQCIIEVPSPGTVTVSLKNDGTLQVDHAPLPQPSKTLQAGNTTEPHKPSETNRVVSNVDTAASKEEKLKQTKLRLKEARARFQESMDRLHEELDIVKSEDSLGIISAENSTALDKIDEDTEENTEVGSESSSLMGVFWDTQEDFSEMGSVSTKMLKNVEECGESEPLMGTRI